MIIWCKYLVIIFRNSKVMSKVISHYQSVIDNKQLGVFIITYNRSQNLEKTLQYILDSVISDFPITVLNNCSTDDTVEIAESFKEKFSNLTIVSNKYNIGLGANFLKAFELSDFVYTWVLCDDDRIHIRDFDDVADVLTKSELDLIHVGAHVQNQWAFGGEIHSPKHLLNNGYPYFRFGSFLPCNIFKTASFIKFMVPAYENVVNAYPHMPFLFDMYLSDKMMYISENQLVFAQPSNSGYSYKRWLGWWMRTCELLTNKQDVRRAYLDQWKDIGDTSNEQGLESLATAKTILDDKESLERFKLNYFKEDLSKIRLLEKKHKERSGLKKIIYEIYEPILKAIK
jgi:glycosyltransferase involved in cell wall biosynthesis